MNSRSVFHSISSTPRRAALPLLVLIGVALLLLQPPSALVYTPHISDASTFGGGSGLDLNDLDSFRGQQAQRPPSQQAIEQQHRQQEYHNDPSFAKGSPSSSKYQAGKQKDQWDWDWVKKTTANKVKESFGWSESESYSRGRGPGDTVSSPPSGGGGKNRVLPQSSVDEEDTSDDILAYHRHLEKEHSPHKYSKHSPTLTFDHIYVLSLPHRTDRRSRMNKIANALGLKFTFVDATSKDSPIIGWIAERVKEIRERKLKILAPILGKPENEIGGMGSGSLWLKGNDEKIGLAFPDLKTLDDRWKIDSLKAASLSSSDTESNEQDEESVASDMSGQEVVDWVTYLDSTDKLDMLKPSNPHLNVSELLYDPVEINAGRQVNDGVVATWYSQTRVWKKMLENKDKSALILEDDVDLEWDIERIWPNVERALKPDWEVVFLGHCWGRELGKPQYVHPQLHKASEPRCLHGYAVSQKGAQHLVELFSDPWRAYQTPVDTFMPFLTRYTPPPPRGQKPKKLKAIERLDPPMFIEAYSMEPAVIIQSKELSSDIQDGLGSNWRGLLADSTWDRVLRDEGHEIKQLTYEETKYDPAIRARPWGSWVKAKAAAAAAAAAKLAEETAETPAAPSEVEGDEGIDGQPSALLTPEEQKSKAREEAMNRVVDPDRIEQERVLQNLPKRPGPMMEGGKNKAANNGGGSNQDVAAAQIQAAIEAAKKGGAHGGRRKGDGNRAGTGPKRLGSHDHE